MDSDIYNLYNLNIINLNELIDKKISIQINNFLYENNLMSLTEKSRDYNKICNHFIIKNIIDVINENYNNIFLYKNEVIYNDYIVKICSLLKLNLFIAPEIPFLIDINVIYQLKSLAESKKNINLKKVHQYFEKYSLTHLTDNLKNNPKTKLILHK
jgi:hypothetical protein